MKYLDDIAKLWAQGLITEEIAKRLGLTKGGVCRRARDARLRGDARFPVRARHVFMLKPKPTEPLPIWQLNPRDCRYALTSGTPDKHLFCAKPQAPGSPYCPEHKALCDGAHGQKVRSWSR